MKTYYWPLVLIGGTLILMGAALPWFRWSGNFVTSDEPTSGYVTGFESGGFLPAVGGGVLVLIALIEKGQPSNPNRPFIVTLLSVFSIGGWALLQSTISDAPTYSPALGFFVPGALLGIIGSLTRFSEADMMMTKIDINILMALECCIVGLGLALLIYPVLGDWAGLWHTTLPAQPCLAPVNLTANRATEYMAQCYATATAKAIQLTPPAWWP